MVRLWQLVPLHQAVKPALLPVRLLILAFLASGAASAADRAGDFDFYVLSLTWSPSYCDNARRPDPRQCNLDIPGFVVHGLWPQYERGYPEYCDSSFPRRLPSSTISGIADVIPSPGAAQYQWEKHGICSGLRPQSYFSLVRQAARKVVIPKPYLDVRSDIQSQARAIEGDFIAAMRLDDGNWVAVAPRAEPFPNQWQTRVLLWFVLSLLLVGPFIWFFARRIVQPLEQFAGTAETLGRNPGASVVPLAGPAEIGRAARAFNQMQSRLRAFVDDRTMMVGAISHDLRTPLTRMRFRLEDVPDSQRDGLLGEVEEMEEMITQVIGFIRDVSAAGPRETVDLATLVEETVRDARVVGAEIEINRLEDAVIDGDFASLRRVLANLLDNAMKYGSHVRVHVSRKGGEASATVIDDGPGITKEEMEQVFDPFYRCEEARASGKPGSGLGLSVCRSIARAHGGDVVLSNTDEGFKATLTLPVAYDAPLGRAA